MQYSIVIRRAPDKMYIASCPLIPEAHAQGKTYALCLSSMKDVMKLCIDYRRERGEEVPEESKSRRVTVAI